MIIITLTKSSVSYSLLRFLDARATVPVGELHVHIGSGRRAPESAAVVAGPGTTVPVGQGHVRCGSARWSLKGFAVGAGAGLGCLLRRRTRQNRK